MTTTTIPIEKIPIFFIHNGKVMDVRSGSFIPIVEACGPWARGEEYVSISPQEIVLYLKEKSHGKN